MTTSGWMAQEPGNDEDRNQHGFSLRDVVRILFARKLSILLIALAVEAGVGLSVFWLLVPTYESKARLHVDLQSAAMASVGSSPGAFVSDLEKIGFFETVMQEIETPHLIETVVEDLNLAETRRIGRIEALRNILLDLKYRLGEYFDLEMLRKTRSPFADAYAAVVDNLSTNRLEGSSLLEINYFAKDAAEAQNTLKAIVAGYIAYRNDFVQQKALGSSEYLRQEVARVRTEMETIEAEWLALTKSDGFELLQEALPAGLPGDVTTADPQQVLGLLTNARAVEEMMLSIVKMQEELERLLSQHTESHPMVLPLRRMIASYTAAVNRAPDMLLEAQRLLRDLGAANSSYSDLLKAYRNTVALESEELRRLNIIKVVQEPTLPVGHASPRRTLAMTAGLFLSLLVGIAFAFLAEFSTDTIHSPDDVRDKLGLPYLTSLKKV